MEVNRTETGLSSTDVMSCHVTAVAELRLSERGPERGARRRGARSAERGAAKFVGGEEVINSDLRQRAPVN